MKKGIFALIGLSLVFALIGCGKKDTTMNHDKMKNMAAKEAVQIDEPVVYYTCPMKMHKDVHSSKPGTCTKCNMDLVPAVITSVNEKEFYGCPMEAHSHVRSSEPGVCDECGMKLKPMKLKQI